MCCELTNELWERLTWQDMPTECYGSDQPFSGWIKADPQVRVNAYYHELVQSLIAVCVTRPMG